MQTAQQQREKLARGRQEAGRQAHARCWQEWAARVQAPASRLSGLQGRELRGPGLGRSHRPSEDLKWGCCLFRREVYDAVNIATGPKQLNLGGEDRRAIHGLFLVPGAPCVTSAGAVHRGKVRF